MTALLSRFLPALFSAALLAGCCANDTCECDDHTDAISLQFQVAPNPVPGDGAFAAPEVDTVYLLRYTYPNLLARAPHDSLLLLRNATQAGDYLTINTNSPFKAVSGLKLNKFQYRISVRLTNRRLQTFLVDSIQLTDKLEGTGCCTCYVNTFKTAKLDNVRKDVTQAGRQAKPIVLNKKP